MASILLPRPWYRWPPTSAILIVSALLSGAGCDDPTAPPEVAFVQITPATWTLTSIGDTVRFRAEAKDASGATIPGHSFRWRAQPSGVVGIRQDGLVTAFRPGVVVVSATTDSVTGTADIDVVQAVASVAFFSGARLTALGDSTRLYVSAQDARGNLIPDATFSFRSLNETIATASPSGSVRSVAPGVANIVATAGGKADTVAVEVRQDVVTIQLTPDTAVMEEGTRRQFTAAMKDRNGYPVTDRSPDWRSSDTLVMTVSSTGLATAVATKLGPAAMIATSGAASGSAPVYVFTSFMDVSAGSGMTCALSSRGRAYCWGWRLSPVPLAVPNAPAFSSIGAGSLVACGLTAAGRAYCWGEEPFGSSPRAFSPDHTFSSLAVGYLRVYGLTSSGDVYLWGLQSPSPTLVPGGLAFAAINGNTNYLCATVSTGAAYCWGSNLTGGLGDGTFEDRSEPTPVVGGHLFSRVLAGGGHTCGIRIDGPLYCWGRNLYGAFGDGTRTYSTAPVPAAGGLTVMTVALGGFHTCGLDGSGAAYCWGFGEWGSLGNGSFDQMQLTPASVAGGLRFVSITAGAGHTCGLTAEGALYCWGSNANSELGDGTVLNRAVPTRVAGSRP